MRTAKDNSARLGGRVASLDIRNGQDGYFGTVTIACDDGYFKKSNEPNGQSEWVDRTYFFDVKVDSRFLKNFKPAIEVGGDLYDFFALDDDHICLLVGDVSGKGVPAAMFMSLTMSYLRAYSNPSALTMVDKLNKAISLNNEENMFVTLFLSVLNINSGEMRYLNAGHTNPYLLKKDKDISPVLASGNTVVGAFEDMVYKENLVYLERGDKLFLFTDGVTEAFSKEGEQFGETKLYESLKCDTECSINVLLDNILTKVEDFSHSCEQSDDITMLCIEYKK